MNKKSIRMILGVSLNVIVIAVGVFIIFTAGSKAYTFGHSIFDEEAVRVRVSYKAVCEE